MPDVQQRAPRCWQRLQVWRCAGVWLRLSAGHSRVGDGGRQDRGNEGITAPTRRRAHGRTIRVGSRPAHRLADAACRQDAFSGKHAGTLTPRHVNARAKRCRIVVGQISAFHLKLPNRFVSLVTANRVR